jgi:stringent starvation protein B
VTEGVEHPLGHERTELWNRWSSEERAKHFFLVCSTEAPTMSQILPPKKDVALALLERASVFVHLDPRGAGVVVPVHFKRQPRLVLQIGLNMAVPIPDLRLDDQGLSCTLSFNRSLFHCVVPWSGIFALVGEDGRGMVWPEDVPQEIAREMSPQKEEGKTDGAGAAPSGASAGSARGGSGGLTGVAGGKKRPHVSLVASGGVRADSKRPSKRAGAKRKPGDGDKPTLFKVEAPEKPSKPSKPTQIDAQIGKRAAKSKPSDDSARTLEKTGSPAAGHAGAKGSAPGAASAASTTSAAPPSKPADGESKPAAPSVPAGSPSSSPPGKRPPKRELPPYLRVVK